VAKPCDLPILTALRAKIPILWCICWSLCADVWREEVCYLFLCWYWRARLPWPLSSVFVCVCVYTL